MSAAKRMSHETDRMTGWFRQHGKAVRGYLWGLVRRDDVVEDLTQEVFRRAWQARGSYTEQGTARAYLIKIADRLVVDRARKNNAEVNVDDETWNAVEPLDRSPAPDESITAGEAHTELAMALGMLTPLQRRVLLMRYYGDMPFNEIAESLGCPLSTALSHCRRGLLALRKSLAEPTP